MRDFYIEVYSMSSFHATSLALGGLEEVLIKRISPTGAVQFRQKYENMAQQEYNMNLYSAQAVRSDYINGYSGTACQ